MKVKIEVRRVDRANPEYKAWTVFITIFDGEHPKIVSITTFGSHRAFALVHAMLSSNSIEQYIYIKWKEVNKYAGTKKIDPYCE